ncbi:MAG: hypothetical protein M3O09_19250 [Acidobacteriota bacterium]|nr:hypothetical protein [Acidobacteriota bacterium]
MAAVCRFLTENKWALPEAGEIQEQDTSTGNERRCANLALCPAGQMLCLNYGIDYDSF